MINTWLKFLLVGVIFIVVQIMLDEFVNNWYMIYLAIFPLFILTLPITMSVSSYMLISFIIGMGIDILSGGLLGINAASGVVIAFIRKPILKMIFPPALLESINIITLDSVKTKSFILLTFITNLIFFTVYLSLDTMWGIPIYLLFYWIIINVFINIIFSFFIELFFVNKLFVKYRE